MTAILVSPRRALLQKVVSWGIGGVVLPTSTSFVNGLPFMLCGRAGGGIGSNCCTVAMAAITDPGQIVVATTPGWLVLRYLGLVSRGVVS